MSLVLVTGSSWGWNGSFSLGPPEITTSLSLHLFFYISTFYSDTNKDTSTSAQTTFIMLLFCLKHHEADAGFVFSFSLRPLLVDHILELYIIACITWNFTLWWTQKKSRIFLCVNIVIHLQHWAIPSHQDCLSQVTGKRSCCFTQLTT